MKGNNNEILKCNDNNSMFSDFLSDSPDTNGDDNIVSTSNNNSEIDSIDISQINRRVVEQSRQQQQNRQNFMTIQQPQFVPQQDNKYDNLLSQNIVQQDQYHTGAASVLFNMSSFSNMKVDNALQSLNYVDDFTFKNVNQVDFGKPMEMEDDPAYQTVVNNINEIKALQQQMDKRNIDRDKVVGITENYESILTKKHSIGDIVNISNNENKINVTRAQVFYHIKESTLKNAHFFQYLQQNKFILDKILQKVNEFKLQNNALIKLFLDWLQQNYLRPDSSESKSVLKQNGYIYDLLTLVNYVAMNEVNNRDVKNLSDVDIGKLAVKVVDLLFTYWKAIDTKSKRGEQIKQFDELISTLQEISLNYVRASPQLAEVTQSITDIMKNFRASNQNDAQFKAMFDHVFGSINSFIAQGSVLNQDFNNINDNFNILYQHYQNNYGRAVGQYTCTLQQLRTLQSEIQQLKGLFSIMTGGNNAQQVANAVADIYQLCSEMYSNKGFTGQQAQVIKEVVDMINVDFNGKVTNVQNGIQDKINQMLGMLQNTVAKADFEKVQEFLKDLVGKDKPNLSELLQTINQQITHLTNITQEQSKTIDMLKGDIGTVNENVNTIVKQLDEMDERYITHDQFEAIRDELKELKEQMTVISNQQQQHNLTIHEIGEITLNNVMAEVNDKLDNMQLAMTSVDPTFSERVAGVEQRRIDFNRKYDLEKAKRPTPEDNNMFAKYYTGVLPNPDDVMNNLENNVVYGITLLEYIQQSISGLDKIVIDDNLDIDITKDNALCFTKILYLIKVFDSLFTYNFIVQKVKPEVMNMINRIKVTVQNLILVLKNNHGNNVKWEMINGYLNTLTGILNGFLKLESDTDLSNIMAITRTADTTMSDAERLKKAWASLVIGCKLIQVNTDKSDKSDTNTVIVELDRENLTVDTDMLLQLLTKIVQEQVPEFKMTLGDLLKTEGVLKNKVDNLINLIKNKRYRLITSEQRLKRHREFHNNEMKLMKAREIKILKSYEVKKDNSNTINQSEKSNTIGKK